MRCEIVKNYCPHISGCIFEIAISKQKYFGRDDCLIFAIYFIKGFYITFIKETKSK